MKEKDWLIVGSIGSLISGLGGLYPLIKDAYKYFTTDYKGYFIPMKIEYIIIPIIGFSASAFFFIMYLKAKKNIFTNQILTQPDINNEGFIKAGKSIRAGKHISATGSISAGESIEAGTSQLKIVSAKYGERGKYIDVTNVLNSQIVDNKLNIAVTNENIVGGEENDPIYGTVKKLIIEYTFNGQLHKTEIREWKTLRLP